MTYPYLPRTYRPLSIALHWFMGVVIVTTFGLGVYMSGMPLSPDKLRYYSWHKWIGVSLFLLAGLRLALRLTTPGAHLPTAYSLQMKLAEWTHRIVYVLMFAIPVSGWLMSSAKGVPTVYFGYWQLPDLVARDAALGRNLQALHVTLNFSMAAIVSGHIVAALKHQFFDRDDVLARMLPCLRARHPREPS
jgi:cytochrome b561